MDNRLNLTHIDETGAAHMVDVGDKDVTKRRAVATALITTRPEVIALITEAGLPKGDALPVARIAAVMGAKRTSDLIPLCHPLPLTGVDVDFTLDETSVRITAAVKTVSKTGVEMEALTAASVAALTIFDMIKAVDNQAVIGDIKVIEKSGGRSGDWRRSA
ncbi:MULTISPECIES: cyclic pyranopterin monophosphate synthase MoaC [Brevibacterium]|uniref:Cyclic pyranopterin monophosphate synthase n=2 Tax=Brevibacteriaceae TaxID=85019 RepID=K9AQM9_9MICO|nr:cyclic pyranopterin monophosphate synthase MoaC [Brevibacterium casei]EKU49599.1 molybdenum cofactor biosynthesis protein MoaC [Brevibacterium casei S18]MBE4693689.1 cyclic pyranopterin monophosphate synthase MoaC [Brevibacterium casei]MBY3576812.1 cyclic pyranopterin monophosphate synthase MoaC [Brevibacterium casei]NJE68551.1 cyclic pyranopterin monophosphate synthase MoaC [Brevibacterium sp. LS14]